MSEKEERKIETMQKQMEESMDHMKKEFDSMRLKADEVMGKGREVVRERPLTFVGLAFGVGLIVGAILVKAFDKD
jgi:ElaB/YqjD/DUF883 family membrane-anchored ribosome-binding protein